MVFIPGGEFLRGRSYALPDDDLKWFPTLLRDDRPVRTLRLNPFYLDVREVTNVEYAKFVEATGRRAPAHWRNGKIPPRLENLPVVNVTWQDAAAYAAWAGKRLPSEAEWERACRGLAEGAKYPWGESTPGANDARFNVLDGPCEVGKYKPNYFGVYDMAGNAWEWCSDWYEKDYYERAPAVNPRGPENGMYRLIRGGSWADVAKYLTCANRSWARPGERSPNIGFRCARDFPRNHRLTGTFKNSEGERARRVNRAR
jgi:formylglycine-generating enzyme required for sulfatase activity